MAKNVALSNDAYEMLNRLKRHGESFSDVVRRLGSEGSSRADWRASFGAFKNDTQMIEMYDAVLKKRHEIRKRRELTW